MPEERLPIGRMVSQTFGVIGRNFTAVGTVAAVAAILTATLAYSVRHWDVSGVTGHDVLVVTIGEGTFSTVVFMVATSGMTHVVVSDLNGSRTSVAQAFATMLRLTPSLLGLGLVIGPFVALAKFGIALNAIFIGFLHFAPSPMSLVLLLLLGLMLVMRWAVAVPARVVEGPSIGSALARSGDLTAGNRWRILGLFMALGLFSSLVTFLVGTALGGAGGLVGGAAQVIAGTITTSVSAIGVAMLYAELRRVREGATPSQLAAVVA